MDELHQVVLKDDLAGRGGEIAPDLEQRGVGLADFQVAAAGFDVLGEHVHAADQVVGIAQDRLAQQFRIGQHEIRRRHRVGDLPHIELGFLLGVRIEAGGVADQLLGPARAEQVSLLEEVVVLVRRPFGIAKALVAGVWRDDRGDLLAGKALCRRRPQIEIGLAQPVLRFESALRVFQPIFGDLAQRFDDFADFLGELVALAAFLARLEIGRQRAPAFLDEPRQIARKLLDVDAADLHRFLGWSPQGTFLTTGQLFGRAIGRKAGMRGAFAQTLLRRHGLRQSATQGIFMGNPGRPRKRFKTRRAAPAVLVSTYYHAILASWMTSQGIFITY